MANDGITTANDMLQLLMEAMELCEEKLKVAAAPTDEKGDVLEKFCPGEWDNLICWPSSRPGAVKMKCPDYIIDFNHDGFASRHCSDGGSWVFSSDANKTWVDYSECYRDLPGGSDLKKNIEDGTPRIKSMIQLYTVGYSFSLVALTFAMFILAYFQRLHCTRNYIHMHLFASFMLRAIVIFVKDRVLFIGAGIFDIQTQSETSLQELLNNMESTPGGNTYKIGCKIVMTLFHYFVATNYYWILVEALYLHSLIFVAFFSDKKYLWRFTLTGWGVPVLFVVPWAIVRGTLEDVHCWDIAITEYKWIYNGPIVVANVINFLLFLNIIRVLWYKMRERGAINRSSYKQQYRKLAKSTLVLIPMFGVHAIVFIGMPDNVTNGVWWDVRMYFDLFFNSFQGFFVAIIYCFCNGEVQAEFKKAWERFNLSVEMKRGNRERSRSSVTMLTSFNSSTSQQGRLSIAGQNNRRNSNLHRMIASNKSHTEAAASNGADGGHHETRSMLNPDSNNYIALQKSIDENLLRDLLNEDESPCLRSEQSNGNGPSSNCVFTLNEQKDDIMEKEFEIALDNVTKTDKNEDVEESESEPSNRNSMNISNEDSTRQGASAKRVPSFDSGISSTLSGTMARNSNTALIAGTGESDIDLHEAAGDEGGDSSYNVADDYV